MVDGGLLPALRHWDDWPSIASALVHVSDLPENDIIQLLAYIVRYHRQRVEQDENAMQIGIPGAPTLARCLAMVVSYRMSPPMARLALKQHFSDAQDILYIIEILSVWLQIWGKAALQEAAAENVANTIGLPSVQSILEFLQNIFDGHFFLLLQYQPSHAVLQQLSKILDLQLSSLNDLDRLQGPLETFARSRAKRQQSQQKPAVKSLDDFQEKKRRREAYQAAELAIGQYQIEDLTL
ncbi:hypothetical protein M422DRAFT_238121 [Sphaerobolus stellatus SS14]|nr:hypothetical protein M422DRAFT_238121 [Sphaerobolus stellatus SS14]